MKNYKSMRGVNIDIGKLLAQQDKNITVGNTASNARGDKLGRAGRVMKGADEIAREHYNRNNPNAVKAASIKLDDTPKPKVSEQPMEDDWAEPVIQEVSPGPVPKSFSEPVEENTDSEWVEDADGNFVKADELKKNKSKKSK
jgi:hypothetical protein